MRDRSTSGETVWGGLTQADLDRYRGLMTGLRGRWSPEADPIVVLGAHARTTQERRRLAELFVRAEYERVEAELAFEREVQSAWERLFPREPRVALGKVTELVERYALVVDRGGRDGGDRVERLLARGAPVDVYVVGADTDDELRAWVAEMGVDVESIRAGRLTVSHGRQAPPGEAPAVWVKSLDGQWGLSR